MVENKGRKIWSGEEYQNKGVAFSGGLAASGQFSVEKRLSVGVGQVFNERRALVVKLGVKSQARAALRKGSRGGASGA